MPLAFAYPTEDPELHEPQIDELIRQSLATKSAISQVSKLFQTIGAKFLYEIVVLRQYHQIRPLVKLLRRDRGPAPVLGWWCKRLDVRLRWKDEGWEYGRHTLWGLLPSCPRLVDLRCSLESTQSSERGRYGLVHPPSEVMLQTLASHHQGLQSLHFDATLPISRDMALRLLRYLPELQVCTFGQILRSKDIETGSSDDESVSSSSSSTESEENYMETLYMCDDSAERAEYEHAVRNAKWPTRQQSDAQALILPRLKALWATPFDKFTDVSGWSLPALERLLIGYDFDGTYGLRHLTEALSQCPDLSAIRFLTYMGYPTDLWQAVELMPLLEGLGVQFRAHSLDLGVLSRPLQHLECITLFREPYYKAPIPPLLESIYDLVRVQKLPALRRVRIWGHDLDTALMKESKAQYEAVSVELEIRTTRYPMDGGLY